VADLMAGSTGLEPATSGLTEQNRTLLRPTITDNCRIFRPLPPHGSGRDRRGTVPTTAQIPHRTRGDTAPEIAGGAASGGVPARPSPGAPTGYFTEER
jgi:hypothetical protein